MRSATTTISIILVLLCAAACGDLEAEKSESGKAGIPPDIIRGHYTFGHEVRSLRPCGDEKEIWVIDSTHLLGKLYEQLTGSIQGEPGIFVIATGSSGPPPPEGFGADYEGAVTIGEVVYAALEGFGCDFDLTGFVYRASGNEPFWMVEVLPGSMRLSRPGHPELSWPQVEIKRSGKSVILLGTGGDLPGRLTIEPGPVHDSMSGAFYSHQAQFELDGDIFKGSALRGLASAEE